MSKTGHVRHTYALTKGVLYIALWYFSIWVGFLFICCPLWPFILLWPKLFLPLMSMAFSVWEMYPVALMNLIFNTKIRMTGDQINALETSLLIVNHRTRIDWNFLWALMYYASQPRCHRMKIALKSSLRHVPTLGWVMQVANCLYLARKWDKDELTMRKQLKLFGDIGHTFQVLLFPEGTDLTPDNLRRSNEYAKKNNLDLYTRVLHPKTTGFVFLVEQMRNKELNLEAVYDLTLQYPELIPQTEMDVFKGNFPRTVSFHIVRHPVKNLPTDKEKLQSWLNERWQEKENRLNELETTTNIFDIYDKVTISGMDNPLYLAFVVWTTGIFFMFYLLYTSTFFQWWTIVHVLLFIGISYFTSGYQTLCAVLHERFRIDDKKDR